MIVDCQRERERERERETRGGREGGRGGEGKRRREGGRESSPTTVQRGGALVVLDSHELRIDALKPYERTRGGPLVALRVDLEGRRRRRRKRRRMGGKQSGVEGLWKGTM